MVFEIRRQILRTLADFRSYPLLKLGIFLLCLPIAANVFWILPAANVYPPIPGYSHAIEPRISSWSDQRLARLGSESSLDFSGRMMSVVHHATYHCSPEQIGQSWWTYAAHKLRLLKEEQGLLSLLSFHCGFCHARAFILAVALRNGGIPDATAYGMGGHVVTTFHLDGARYVADPDFGIHPFILPEDPSAIRKAVEKNYSPIVRYHNPETIAELNDIYSSLENNLLYSFEYLINLRDSQDEVLEWQRPIEIAVFLVGLTMIGFHVGLRLYRSGRRKRVGVQTGVLARS